MQKFICQSENQICDTCDSEIPKGAWVYVDGWENLVCEDCGSEQEDTDEQDFRGERYG